MCQIRWTASTWSVFRGGLVFKAHRLLYHSTLSLRVIKREEYLELAVFAHLLERHAHRPVSPCRERDFFIDNLLVRIHLIIVMIRWTGLAAPWEFEFPSPGSLISTFPGEFVCLFGRADLVSAGSFRAGVRSADGGSGDSGGGPALR